MKDLNRVAHSSFKLTEETSARSFIEHNSHRFIKIQDVIVKNGSCYIVFAEYEYNTEDQYHSDYGGWKKLTLENVKDDLFRMRNAYFDLRNLKDNQELLKKYAELEAGMAKVRQNFARESIELDKVRKELDGFKGKGAVWQCRVCSGPPWNEEEDTAMDLLLKENKELQEKIEVYETSEEPEKVEAEVLPFQPKLNIITGGRGGGDDWLSNLKEGAIFVSKRNDDKSPLAEQWHVQIKWGKSTILHSNFPQPQEVTILVVNQEFSQMNKLVEIILAEKQELRYD